MKKMKERTYGWYPSVRDVYLSKNQPTPYHLECLYRFQESGYHNPIVEPPEPAFIVRGIAPTPSPPPSRPSTARGPVQHGMKKSGHRPKSVPVPKFRPVPKTGIPTPSQVWKKGTTETPWGVTTTPSARPESQLGTADVAGKDDNKPTVSWPTQHIMDKYDKPLTTTVTAATVAEEVFETPLPPRDPGYGGDSGYVFIPTGDGGVEVHSPPVYWPDSQPRALTPQFSVSSKASIGSADGIATRRKIQDNYQQQVLKEQEEKRKQKERQRRFDNLLRQQQYQARKKTPEPPKTARPAQRRERVMSATTRRDKTPVPKRPVYSARPSRAASDSAVYTQQNFKIPHATELELYRAWEKEEESPGVPSRPDNPLPPTPSLEDLVIEEDRSPSPQYEDVVNSYGWRAEVHGDPYSIKKVTKRLPYTVKCEEPQLAPEPPKVHMESKDTYFLNTIPRRHATFDVHQDWLSESLHAKRIELQKRDGVNYRYKRFGFAY